jgi:hypothetical protein
MGRRQGDGCGLNSIFNTDTLAAFAGALVLKPVDGAGYSPHESPKLHQT